MKNKLIETRQEKAEYDIPATIAVVDTESHGRILIRECYGGENTLAGGTVRWRHGAAYQLQPDDTIDSLSNAAWNDDTSHYQAVICGHDDEIPMLDWDGYAIENIAKSVGL